VSKSLITSLLYFLFVSVCTAQEKDSIPDIQKQEIDPAQNEAQEIDSLQNDLRKDGIIIVDTLKKRKVNINPLAPSKAAFYSAVFPGLGQLYNKRYWKAPIVWGLLGSAVAGYLYNDDLYKRYRTAFKRRQAGFIDDEFYDRFNGRQVPNQDLGDLQTVQEARQRDRDLWLVGAIALYVLNIVDANVDAHLKQFNVDEDLSFDMQPYLEVNPVTNQPNYGMAVVVKF